MEICGVIAEYNPFHSGHRYQLAAARAASGAGGIVCVMSTSFTQRGEPALLPPHTRARMALEGGADLVIALPLPFAMAGAERFARGGVALLAAAGCTHLAFGCESADPDALEQTARYLLSADFSRDLKPHLAGGRRFCPGEGTGGYPGARSKPCRAAHPSKRSARRRILQGNPGAGRPDGPPSHPAGGRRP